MNAGSEHLEETRSGLAVFQNHHRWDRIYHLVWLASAWAAIVAGFGPNFYKKVMAGGDENEPLVLEIHAFVFTAWLVLISVQIGLVNRKKIRMHMKLGLLSVPLGVAVVLAGVAVAAHAARAAFDKSQELASLQFFFHQLMDMAVFGGFFAAAIVTRKSAATHKRVSVLATTFLLGAGFSRAISPLAAGWFEGTSQALQFAAYLAVAYGGINLLMAMAILYDWITRRRVHPVNLKGTAIILGCEILTICVVQHVPAWGRVAHWLLYWK
jgi:hypothetical protein